MPNFNKYVKFPLNFQTGLGYSPWTTGQVGGASWPHDITPGTSFYSMPLYSILPNGTTPTSNSHFFGRKKHRRRSNRKRRFGYPLMNLPNQSIDMNYFPNYPVGDGNSSGGSGGQFLQGLPSFQQYWGFGKLYSKKKKRYSRRR